jgi:hypothetical protein
MESSHAHHASLSAPVTAVDTSPREIFAVNDQVFDRTTHHEPSPSLGTGRPRQKVPKVDAALGRDALPVIGLVSAKHRRGHPLWSLPLGQGAIVPGRLRPARAADSSIPFADTHPHPAL